MNRLRRGRGFIAEKPVIHHPENAGEKQRSWQNQRLRTLDDKTESQNRQKHRQAEENHFAPPAYPFFALGRLAALKRVGLRMIRNSGWNAVARDQINHAVQTEAAARTKSHAVGSRLITTSWTKHRNLYYSE